MGFTQNSTFGFATAGDPSGGTVTAADNGLSLVGSTTVVLGQDVSQSGNPAAFTSIREIPLNTFQLKFTNGVVGESVSIAPNEINVGTDNHFSNSNLIGNRVFSLTGTTNVSTDSSVASGGTGGYGSGYMDSRYTFVDTVTIRLRMPSSFDVGLDLLNATTTYNNNSTDGFISTWSRLSIGGIRRSASYSGTISVTLPSILNDAVAVDRIQFNMENNIQKVLTGNVVGLAIGTRFGALAGSSLSFYSDLLLGTRTGGADSVNLAIATRCGAYILPIKTAVVTTAYGIYQEGTSDINYFGGTVGVGVAALNASAKLQIDSTTQGFLPPRMTTTQRDAIGTPAAGLVIYNTTTSRLNFYTSSWQAISVFSANNGLSVSSGNAVFGQDAADVTNPAILTSNRTIPTATFSLLFISNTATIGAITIAPASAEIQVGDSNGNQAGYSSHQISLIGEGVTDFPTLGLINNDTGFETEFREDATGCKISSNAVFSYIFTDGKWGINTNIPNGAWFQINGDATLYRSISNPTSNPEAVTANDTFRVFTNTGATAIQVYTLPGAAAGLTYTYVVTDSDGITITAAAGDTIRFDTTVTATGGSISSTAIGSTITLVAVDATQWIAIEIIGTWA